MRVDQRQALATLTKAQLREIADTFDLEPPSTLLKDDLVDLLGRSRRSVTADDIFSKLRICRACSRSILPS